MPTRRLRASTSVASRPAPAPVVTVHPLDAVQDERVKVEARRLIGNRWRRVEFREVGPHHVDFVIHNH